MQPELSRTDYSAFRGCSQTETLHRREVGWALAVHTSRIARQPEIRRGMPSLQTGRGHMVFERVGSESRPTENGVTRIRSRVPVTKNRLAVVCSFIPNPHYKAA